MPKLGEYFKFTGMIEGSPLQGLSEAQRGNDISKF